MFQDYEKLFNYFKGSEPPEYLLNRIMRRIKKERKKRAIVFSTIMLISFGILIPVFNLVRTDFLQSGFMEFLLLFFSDTGAVLSCGRSFIFALLESFPTASVIIFLAAISVFLQSFKAFMQNAKMAGFLFHNSIIN